MNRLHDRSEILLNPFSTADRELMLRDPAVVESLAVLSNYSPALAQALSTRTGITRWLFLDKSFLRAAPLETLSSELRTSAQGAANLPAVQKVLREFRLKEIARLAVRDLTGRADLDEVTATLTAVAEACLGESLDAAMRLTAERYDLTPDSLGIRPVILGMGKLGAWELNYSSDVDLIYMFQPTMGAATSLSPEKAADQVFTTVTRAMSEVTEDGLVFRVDLDLRPGGKDGAQAQSLEKAQNHYLFLGQSWERLALLKARPVAGRRDLGFQFLEEIKPFIFRRHLDYTTIEELKALKVRFTRQRNAQIGRSQKKKSLNVKLSPGGIREIEFFAQALTLTFGGRLPHLQQSRTVNALAALSREGIIEPEDEREMAEAYVFLRTVEHRLQLFGMTQTQTLPKNPDFRENLALSMGFKGDPWAGFQQNLDKHMFLVGKRFNQLLEDPEDKATGEKSRTPEWVDHLQTDLADDETALEILNKAGFIRPDAALKVCRNIVEGRYLPQPLGRYTRHLERLFPALVSEAASSSNPDRVMLHLEQFLSGIGPRAGFLVLLEENPHLFKLLSILFGESDYLSSILIQHPSILDSLVDRRSALPEKDPAMMARELDIMLSRDDDLEANLAVIRRFKNDETLRIGLYDLLGKLTLGQISQQLTDLAETVMERTLARATRTVLLEDRPVPLSIMGLGKLGGKELSYGSDLDLIFIVDDEALSDDVKMETVVRLTQRFINYLSTPLEAGPGYEIDSRLRPSGRQGPLVVTLDSFRHYHETSQLWERQALIKMRQCLGPASLGREVMDVAWTALFQRELPEDAGDVIHDLRQRMTRERGRVKPGTINLKFSPGGLVDVEFLTQYLQLIHGRTIRGNLLSPSTRLAMEAMVEHGYGPAGLSEAGQAYDTISRTLSRLGLIYDRSGDRTSYTPEEIQKADLPWLGPDPLKSLQEAMDLIVDLYSEVFHPKVNHAS